MRILALETTESHNTVAALDGNNLLLERHLDPSQRSAQSLAPGLRDLLKEVGWRPSDVQLVAVPVGPGSFTGLRVGVTAAKTLAYAVGAEVLGLDTLEVVATRAPGEIRALSVVMDAQRGQVLAGSFVRGDDGWFRELAPTTLLDSEVWLAGLAAATIVTGPGLSKLAARLPEGATALAPELWSPTAATVGLLAARRYEAGQRDDLWKLTPRYFRLSAAEEKWKAEHL
ncbi:MAG: tRNA (adenosine(37)-N6)-threonylcarbamoyltransferase complex dimerization subunit type 1 TsaB [Pirellulales bacterium]